jgi:oxygen-independent coproporphyrinogen-3 oxidase
MSGARHLYVHLPFCASRCGYCDFVTVVGREGQHEAYVDALLAELRLEGKVLARSPGCSKRCRRPRR